MERALNEVAALQTATCRPATLRPAALHTCMRVAGADACGFECCVQVPARAVMVSFVPTHLHQSTGQMINFLWSIILQLQIAAIRTTSRPEQKVA